MLRVPPVVIGALAHTAVTLIRTPILKMIHQFIDFLPLSITVRCANRLTKGVSSKLPIRRILAHLQEAEGLLQNMAQTYIPEEDIPPGDETARLHRWGYQTYRQLFGRRQLLGLQTLATAIAEVEDEVIRQALLTVFSDTLRYQNMLCRYDTYALKIIDIFSIHGFEISISQNFARTLDRQVRTDRQAMFSLTSQSQERVLALITSACKLLQEGIGKEVPEDTIHRLDKADTRSGVTSLKHLAIEGVPYAMLLYERFLGRPFAGHRDAVSELVGEVMENAVEKRLRQSGISFRKTKRAERIEGFDQAPDFIVPDEWNPQSWISMIGTLEAVDSEEIAVTYIRHLWSSRYGLTRERGLYDKIKERITSKQGAIDFANDLSENARLYAAMLNSGHDTWSEYGATTRDHMATLNILRMVQLRPLLLAILNEFSTRDVRECLRLLVSWSVRFLIFGGLGGGPLESRYCQRAAEIKQGKIKTAKDLLAAMSSIVPTDSQFKNAFANASVSKNYLARYYFRVLEKQVRGEPDPELIPNPNEDIVTLEHILPENPSSAWGYIEPEIAKAYYKRIGNLALLTRRINSEIRSEGFLAKRQFFKESDFKLTNSLTEYSSWGVEQIEKRQNDLGELAVQAWPNKV